MKLNKDQLKIILDDLYAIDPKLHDFETELEKIIREIVELEPEIKFDENFRKVLKARLIKRAEELQETSFERKPAYNFFAGRFSYGLAGALVLAIIVIGAGFYAQKQGIITFPNRQISNLEIGEQPFSFKKIALNSKSAFGPLAGTTQPAPGTSAAAPSGVGGGAGARSESGGGGSATSSVAPSFGLGGGGGIAFPNIYYKYVYKGEPLELKDSQIEVLRRAGFDQDASSFGSLLKNFGLGMVNLGSFTSLKVQNVNLAEEKDFGYTISANVQEGTIYISQNWIKWPQPYKLCLGDTACVDQNRIQISQVLSDSEVIKIAQDFIKAHGINLSSFGEPTVTDTWRIEYQKAEDKSQFYIPESANVLFPLKVNDNFVYDESGSKTGMNVSVDYRQKKVSGVGNLASQTYQASNYDAETDAGKIIKIVEQGGYWGYPYPVPMAKSTTPESMPQTEIMPQPATKEIEIQVDTPKKEYVVFSNYSNNQTNYLLVPSLIFPVINNAPDANYYYPRYIVVPLAKELLDQRQMPVGIMKY